MLNVLGRFECVRQILQPGSALDLPAYTPLLTGIPPFDWPTTVDVYADLLLADPAAAIGPLPMIDEEARAITWTAPDWTYVALAWDDAAPRLTVRRPPTATAHTAAIQAVVANRLAAYAAAACYFDAAWLTALHIPEPPGTRVLWRPGQVALYQADGDRLVTPAGVFEDADRDVWDPAWMADAPEPYRRAVWDALDLTAVVRAQSAPFHPSRR